MDPNETMDRLIEALAMVRLADARDHFEDLVEWLEAGGFAPRDPRGPK